MLVVVHEHDAVHVGGDEFEIKIIVVHGDRDIELHAAGVKIVIHLGQQCIEISLGAGGKGFEVDHDAAVFVGSEKVEHLLAEVRAGIRIGEERSDTRDKVIADWVEVVHQRKDFRLGAGGLEKRHDFVVDRLEAILAEDVKRLIFRGGRFQMAVGVQNMEPFRKQKIDLRSVGPQRRVAGRIPSDVEGGTNAFVSVEMHLRTRQLRLAVRAAAALQAAFFLFLFPFGQRMVRVLFHRKNKPWEGFAAERSKGEKQNQQRDANTENVKQAANPLPARLFGVVENGLCHGLSKR